MLLYCPVDAFDRKVFDVDTLLRLPAEFPELGFVLVPSPAQTLPGNLPPNLECHDWVDDIDTLYREISLYVRLTTHDGVSFMVLECLARGRHVIWPFAMPGVTQASGFESVAAVVRELAAKHAAGTLELNEAGRAYVMEHYDAERLTRELSARLRTIAQSGL